MKTQMLVMIVSPLLVAVCGCHGPEGVYKASEGWTVVDVEGEVLDLRTRKTYSLVPYLRSVMGERLFAAYQRRDDPTRMSSAVVSPDARYIACKSQAQEICMVSVDDGAYEIIPPPEPGRSFDISAWHPQRPWLLCEVYWKVGDADFRGHLYLLRFESSRWSWKKLSSAGETVTPSSVTRGAWVRDDAIVYCSGGTIYRLQLPEGMPVALAEGGAPYGLSDGSIICERETGFFSPRILLRPDDSGKGMLETALKGDGITMNTRPVISPDGRYVLFRKQSLASVFGHAGISYDLCLYGVDSQRFHHLASGYWAGPAVEVVGGRTSWVNDETGLREKAEPSDPWRSRR